MGRPKGIPNSATVEEWQTTFARWPAAQREEALRTLAAINRCIVENEKSRAPQVGDTERAYAKLTTSDAMVEDEKVEAAHAGAERG